MITVGCDVGALFTKLVLLDEGELVASQVVRTKGRINEELEPLVTRLLADQGLERSQVTTVGATGRGAAQVTMSDFVEVESSCAAAAAAYHTPEVEAVVHLGGQSVSAMLVDDEGVVGRLVRNDKCAAGTGRFLEMVCRRFDIGLEEVDALVARASSPVSMSDQCVVYAESEVISHLNHGERVEDILAGVCDSLGRMVAAQGRRLARDRTFTLTGGVARLASVTQVVAAGLAGHYAPFPADPWLAPALGAALFEDGPDHGDD